MKKRLDIVLIIIAIILCVGVMTVFHACEQMDGMWMNCHYAQLGVFAIGLVLLVIGVATMFVGNKKARLALRGLGVVLAIVAMLLPGTIIEMCMMDTMRCHALMKPFAVVMSLLYIIAELAALVLDIRGNFQKETA